MRVPFSLQKSHLKHPFSKPNESPGHKKTAGIQRFQGFEIGAGDEIRTHDIHLGKVALYH
jgi:hypothetical protein